MAEITIGPGRLHLKQYPGNATQVDFLFTDAVDLTGTLSGSVTVGATTVAATVTKTGQTVRFDLTGAQTATVQGGGSWSLLLGTSVLVTGTWTCNTAVSPTSAVSIPVSVSAGSAAVIAATPLSVGTVVTTTETPLASGTAAIGTSPRAARADHVHAPAPGSTESMDAFRLKANGFPTQPDRGPAYTLYGGSVGAAARPTVVSGKLTQAVTPAASYAQLQLAGTGRRIGGRFTFSSGSTTDNGSAVLALWASPYAGGSVPDCSVHLAVKPTAAIFAVWSENVFTSVATWPFASPLAADGSTVHVAEVVIDTPNALAYVRLPDGTVRVVSHATIGLATPDVAVWEIYTEAGTDPIAAFVETWADSTDPAPLASIVAEAWSQPTRCAQYNATGVADSFVPTTSTAINESALTISTNYPPSGKLLITCSANYRSLSSGQRLFWDFYYGATNLGVIEPLTDQPADDLTGTRMGRLMLTGTPGAAVTMQWRHRALASNQVIFQVDTFRPAIMTVEPVR